MSKEWQSWREDSLPEVRFRPHRRRWNFTGLVKMFSLAYAMAGPDLLGKYQQSCWHRQAVAGEWACRRSWVQGLEHSIHTKRATGSEPQGQEPDEVGENGHRSQDATVGTRPGACSVHVMSGGGQQGGHWAQRATKLLRDCPLQCGRYGKAPPDIPKAPTGTPDWGQQEKANTPSPLRCPSSSLYWHSLTSPKRKMLMKSSLLTQSKYWRTNLELRNMKLVTVTGTGIQHSINKTCGTQL